MIKLLLLIIFVEWLSELKFFYCTSNPIYWSLPMRRCKEIPGQFNTIFFFKSRDCSCNEMILKMATWPIRSQLQNLTILLTSSDTNLSIRIITKSFMWLKLPETTITDLQISWHQTTEVNTLLAFYSNVLIALRLTIRLKNSLQSQLGEQQCYGYPSAYFYDLHLFLCFWLLFLYKAMQ